MANVEPIKVVLPEAVRNSVYERAGRRAHHLIPHAASDFEKAAGLRRQVRGVAAEEAVMHLLRTALGQGAVEDLGDSQRMSSDIRVTTRTGTFGVEVKATTYDWWLKYGRAVTESQLASTDAIAYVWCATYDTGDLRSLHVIGWSATEDVRATAAPQTFSGSTPRAYVQGQWMPDPVYDQDYSWTEASGGPTYDIEDAGFDAYEWQQDMGNSELLEVSAESDLFYGGSFTPQPDLTPLTLLKGARAWEPGRMPWPHDGPDDGKPIVRVEAPILSFADLIGMLA